MPPASIGLILSCRVNILSTKEPKNLLPLSKIMTHESPPRTQVKFSSSADRVASHALCWGYTANAMLMLSTIGITSLPAHAYDRATIRNRSLHQAIIQVNYPGCKNDSFIVPAATYSNGQLIEGVASAPTNRGGCLITWIAAVLIGSQNPVQRYESSGTSYSNFILQGSNSGYRIWSDQELAAENSRTREGKSPGFYITNKTIRPVSVALEQVGCLYYGTLKPGESFDRNTGAVWFTIKAHIQPDGQEPRKDWDCAKPVAAIVGAVLVGAVTAGYGAVPAAGTAAAALAPIAAGGTASVVAGAAIGGGLSSAAVHLSKATAEAAGTKLTPNGSAQLMGQYAGYEWPFRCDQKPTYEIRGGWGKPYTEKGEYYVDKGTQLQIVKTNDCGNKMMS